MMPKGRFDGNSTYENAYVGTQAQRNLPYRPEGEIKLGGKFEGNSSYTNHYENY